MGYQHIRSALVTAYKEANLGVETTYENMPFHGGNSKPSWAVFLFRPSQPFPVTLGDNGADRVEGFVQIDHNIALEIGEAAALDFGDKLRKVFREGVQFTYGDQAVRIKSCGLSFGRVAEGFWRTSFTIYWYADISRQVETI